jgi:hypothetical protein
MKYILSGVRCCDETGKVLIAEQRDNAGVQNSDLKKFV